MSKRLTSRLVPVTLSAICLACLSGGPVTAEQRGPTGQQQRGGQPQQPQPQQLPQTQQQQQIARMQEMIRHTEQVATRAQEMSQSFGVQAGQAEAVEQRERLRILQQMCDSIAVSARETRRSMDRIRDVVQEGTMTQDRDMQRDMEQMQERLQVVAGGLEDALNAMVRVQQRLGPSDQ